MPLAGIAADDREVPLQLHIDLRALEHARPAPLPRCLRIVLENLARQSLNGQAVDAELRAVLEWDGKVSGLSVPLAVSRVIFPDSSGLPALMDLAAARDAVSRAGHPPEAVEPVVPLTLVVDHSLIVDHAGSPEAESLNIACEYERNAERYAFFKWAQQAFRKVQVVPPGAGIIHQVHLERLARVVESVDVTGHGTLIGPEFVLGCDSHTPMINGLGVLGWGVGGIDGEAAALGQPYVVRVPRVVGVRLHGALATAVTTTDLVLTLTEALRAVGVVGAFVEFFGPGVATLSVPERATLANMAPEYGATVGYFPIDDRTLEYLEQSAREPGHVDAVARYTKAVGLFVDDAEEEAVYSDIVDLDLGNVEPSVAGPSRPQDRVALGRLGRAFRETLVLDASTGGFGIEAARVDERITLDIDGQSVELAHGRVVIAAITSCTNTSNPSVMLGAGLLARNARRRGLQVPAWVKTSLAPGSRLVRDYLEAADLLEPLEALGFHVVGYGCTTCSGKSGPIDTTLATAIEEHDLVAAAVLSGNRNFEGRIHPSCRAAYLMSPPLVVAFALAGRVNLDLDEDPLAYDEDGQPVYLHELWPAADELDALVRDSQRPARFTQSYASLFDGSSQWQALLAPEGPCFAWDAHSTYIRRPPFFEQAADGVPDVIDGARVLVMAGDSLTTDHVTPSGAIPADGMGGRYLREQGVAVVDFNAVTQRRGNHDFMARVTFANPRLRNLLCPSRRGGYTRMAQDGQPVTVHAAAERYRADGVPLMVLAGKDYGMGSSRDWAAKGPSLLGVSVVLAESFERIHRANLIGMGIAPLVFSAGESAESLGLDGFERYGFVGLAEALAEGSAVRVTADSESGRIEFQVAMDVSGSHERELLRAGGLFSTMLARVLDSADAARTTVAGEAADQPLPMQNRDRAQGGRANPSQRGVLPS